MASNGPSSRSRSRAVRSRLRGGSEYRGAELVWHLAPRLYAVSLRCFAIPPAGIMCKARNSKKSSTQHLLCLGPPNSPPPWLC